ncbi:hypothetical protein NBRC116587_18710 [Pseudoteredinibacter isoporae]
MSQFYNVALTNRGKAPHEGSSLKKAIMIRLFQGPPAGNVSVLTLKALDTKGDKLTIRTPC